MELQGMIPMLVTNDLPATVAYYTETLGFRLDATWKPEGPMTWARVSSADVALMFVTPDEDEPPVSPTITGELYCYPPDVDALWRELKDRADVVQPIADWDHGMREFQIRDCNGYVLRFGREVGRAPVPDGPVATVERYFDALRRRDFDALADTLAEDVCRIGPYRDEVRGRDAYLGFLADVLPTLPGHAIAVSRYHRVEDGSVFAELEETVEVEGVPTAFPEAIRFGFDDARRIDAVDVYLKQPPRPDGRGSEGGAR